MRLETAKRIFTAAKDLGLVVQLYPGYYGRGAIKATAGIVLTEKNALSACLVQVALTLSDTEEGKGEAKKLVQEALKFKSDSLVPGLVHDYVYY